MGVTQLTAAHSPLSPLNPQASRLVPRQSKERIPNCQRCGQPMSLLAESDWNWQFGCYACGCAHVFSKPQAEAAAKYRAQMERQAELTRRVRQHNSRPKYFLLRSK